MSYPQDTLRHSRMFPQESCHSVIGFWPCEHSFSDSYLQPCCRQPRPWTSISSTSGQSMLVDTGWAGFNNRDADRIADAAKLAGVKQIDYLVITHYHADHVGGVPQLAAKLPVKHYVDHGPNREEDSAERFK